jgi:hypothetical protein
MRRVIAIAAAGAWLGAYIETISAQGAPAKPAAQGAPAKAATPAPTAPSRSPGAGPIIVFETVKGSYEIETYPNEAPKTVEHILALVKRSFGQVISGMDVVNQLRVPDVIRRATIKAAAK